MGSEIEKYAQKLYDAFPNEEALLEFDPFFVGHASEELATTTYKPSTAWQLTDVNTVQSLREKPEENDDEIRAEDDLNDFVLDKVDVRDEEAFVKLFSLSKKAAFDIFGFLDIKSSFMGDVPLREEDLILDDNDLYVVDYLQRKLTDYFAISSVATLMAYDNMGIQFAKFIPSDGCPLCEAHHGLFFEVRPLINLFSGGDFPVHPYCSCQWFPIIHREFYDGVLSDHLNLSKALHQGVEMSNVPVEMKRNIFDQVATTGVKKITFTNLPKYLSDMDVKRENTEGIVAFQNKDILIVHNSYVDLAGPVEFLKAFVREETGESSLPLADLEGKDVYFISGRRVAKHRGSYWDLKTGEKVK